MGQNEFIEIVASPELTELKLEELTGRRAMIVEDLTLANRKIKGYVVLLQTAYQNEFLWFVPENSIRNE